MSIPTITLNNGVKIPQLGFGVFQVPNDETAAAAIVMIVAATRRSVLTPASAAAAAPLVSTAS